MSEKWWVKCQRITFRVVADFLPMTATSLEKPSQTWPGGYTKVIPSFWYVPNSSKWWKHYLPIKYHARIWHVSKLLWSGDEHRIPHKECFLAVTVSLKGAVNHSGQRADYSRKTRSISWLDIYIWLHVSPADQQPWLWFCWINRSLSFGRKCFNYPVPSECREIIKLQMYISFLASWNEAHSIGGLRCLCGCL